MEQTLGNKTSTTNKLDDYQLLTCSCEGTMVIDIRKIAKGLGILDAPVVHDNLCRAQLASFEKSAGGKKTLLTCTQEAPMFDEIAAGLEDAQLKFVNIRENAGWSKTNKNVPAKMTALIAEGNYEASPARLLSVRSEGNCLVYGGGQQAMDISTKLAGRLNITLVFSHFEDVFVPASTEFLIYSGKSNHQHPFLQRSRLVSVIMKPLLGALADNLPTSLMTDPSKVLATTIMMMKDL